LGSPPARRTRRAHLHHWYSTLHAGDLLHRHHSTSGHTCVPRTPSPSLSSTFPEGDLDITIPTRASMIACCGSRTRLSDARSRAELASSARPIRRRQGRRDPDASARGRGTASHEHPAETDLARPCRAQRTEQTAARRAAPGAAGVAPNTIALAPPQPSGRYDETGSAASSTNTCRSHEVTGLSAPTPEPRFEPSETGAISSPRSSCASGASAWPQA
jgi:hypothetical protein